jgi:hypothetical protein
VEVSKYTEGVKEKARRPNGLPESLIRYDARQRDRATESVMELVGAFKQPIAGDLDVMSMAGYERPPSQDDFDRTLGIRRGISTSRRRWSESRRISSSPIPVSLTTPS